MKDLSIIILSEVENNDAKEESDFVFADERSLVQVVKTINSKYIVFSRDTDDISDEFLSVLNSKVKEDFDCCFINYDVNYDYTGDIKILTNEKELSKYKPYYGEYIWSFIFDREKFLDIIEYRDQETFNKMVDSIFEKTTSIGNVLYLHNQNANQVLKNFCYTDYKKTEYYKNVIYISNGCNCVFNGYVSWVKNIGRCFGDKYDITIMYDNLWGPTKEYFSKYFRCVKRDYRVNYVANRLLTVYNEYFYPKNIFTLEENYNFIHGNMSDFENVIKYSDDIYSKYIAVSKVAAEKAAGYFPTNNIEYILNPFKLEKELLKPHLRLVSAHRFVPVKGPERIELFAQILNELDIPFTWNVFTDKQEGTNKNGLIYRSRVSNPLPYIQDSDYFVAFSDSEAFGYSVLEALALNKKVIVTPLDAFEEIGVKDGVNSVVIPFDYFEPENKDKLIEIIMKIYKEKEKEINYKYEETNYDGYNDLFIE